MPDELDEDRVIEQLLVLRAQTGDRNALCDLIGTYTKKLYYYLRRILEEPADADDVLQEVWLRVTRKIGGLNEPAAFRAWLYQIAHNQAISRIRKRRTHVTIDSESEPLVDDSETTERELLETFGANRLNQALEQLNPNHREVLTLRFLEELSYEEVSRIVGCSLGTVRSRLHYAKKQLKAILTQALESN